MFKVKPNEFGLNGAKKFDNFYPQSYKTDSNKHCEKFQEHLLVLELDLENLDQLSQVGCCPNPTQNRFS